MKTTTDKILTCLLTPLSWIYGAVMWVRNKLFDFGLLHQSEYEVPVIGVGNITVGGTGKTPHTEYIVSHLCSSYKVAVLSRGYKRKTRGFIVANSKSTPDSIGDESWQIYNKFGMRARVAVCEDRRKGIRELLRLYPDLDLIVLDDSFQHRWVKPRVSVLLMEYGRPVYKDRLLPLGRLRESAHEINRADKVIVTKCPDSLSPIDLRIVTKELDLMKFQKLYFSRYAYGELKPVFPDEAKFKVNIASFSERDSIFLLTGIAHPHYFVRHFRQYPCRKKVEHFPDHHDFSRSDIQKIAEKFKQMKGERKIIVTTEKDAVRLVHNPYFPPELKPYTFFQPIEVDFVAGTYEHDNDLIRDLVAELHLDPTADYPVSSQSTEEADQVGAAMVGSVGPMAAPPAGYEPESDYGRRYNVMPNEEAEDRAESAARAADEDRVEIEERGYREDREDREERFESVVSDNREVLQPRESPRHEPDDLEDYDDDPDRFGRPRGRYPNPNRSQDNNISDNYNHEEYD